MAKRPLAAIILAAGEGTRMKSRRPKVLHPIGGKPMLGHVLETARSLKPARTVIVAGSRKDEVEAWLKPRYPNVKIAVQTPQLGTGHAVLSASAAIKGFDGDVLVLYGDVPLVTLASLKKLLAAQRKAALGVIGFHADNPAAYGRIIHNRAGDVINIVEARDATAAEKKITFCNSGIIAADCRRLFALLAKVKNDNAKREYYLTDVVALASAEGGRVVAVEGREEEFQGVNSKAELTAGEAALQQRLRKRAMEKGATLIAPETIYLSADTRIAADATIGPFVVFGPGSVIEAGATIHAFCHIEGARVRKGASVGPFARLRPGADIGESAKVGNYVEVKKATLAKGAKANHLAYVGDAKVGAAANVGAGVITCNYDGFAKHVTEIGEGAFIGSNAALIAPVKVGKGAIVGAGSVITEDVPADAMAIARAGQKTVKHGAKVYRKSRSKKA